MICGNKSSTLWELQPAFRQEPEIFQRSSEVGELSHQRIPAKPVFELVERPPLHSELWRVRIRHTERPLHAQ